MDMISGDAPLLVGVDVGTTNIKAIVFDAQGHPVRQASVPTPTYFPRPGWAYFDAEELWQQTARAIRQALEGIEDSRRVMAIGVASFGETVVPLDARGTPTFEAIAWYDNRTEEEYQWLLQALGRERLFAITGLAPLPMFSLCKILWIRRHAPDAFRRTARWLLAADYIAYRLCGNMATDYSLASRTMALDIHRLRWSEEILAAVGLSPSIFAPLCPSGTRLGAVGGETAAQTGLPAHTVVAAGGHDHVVGAYAVGAHRPGVMLNSLGTAEAIFLPLARPLTDVQVGLQGYTQGVHVVDGYYVFGGQYTSGGSVEWFRKAIAPEADYGELIRSAESIPPGSLGVQFLPHLRQASPPHVDVRARGAFIGLSSDVDRATLFRALLEGLAFETRSTAEPLYRFAGLERPEEIVAIGGGTRNALLMQIKASVMEQPLIVVGVEEATSLGAAVLGGVGAGIYPNREAGAKALRLDTSIVEPNPNWTERYRSLYSQVYVHLYETLRPLHHTLVALTATEAPYTVA